eukprot:5691151-Heterocapsa_arctica.AAC.1
MRSAGKRTPGERSKWERSANGRTESRSAPRRSIRWAELNKDYGEDNWNEDEDQLDGLCEFLSSRAMNMRRKCDNMSGCNMRVRAEYSRPIGFKDGSLRQQEFRPHL